jgi:predicted nucleotidyltransferase
MSDSEFVPSRSVGDLAETLRGLGIKFALVGGIAVALVSTPRYTADVDAVILDVDDRLEWLIAELVKAGFTTRATDQVAMTRRTRVLNLTDRQGVGIDLMLGLLPFDEDLVARATEAKLFGDSRVPVALPEHLVVMKAIAWRPKDLQDIREIVAINPDLDRDFAVATFAEFAELLGVPERIAILIEMLGKPA